MDWIMHQEVLPPPRVKVCKVFKKLELALDSGFQ